MEHLSALGFGRQHCTAWVIVLALNLHARFHLATSGFCPVPRLLSGGDFAHAIQIKANAVEM